MAKKKIKYPKVVVKETYNGKRTSHHLANGKLHRVGSPAIILERGSDDEEYHEWWRNGRKHRPDGPAQYHFFKSTGNSKWESYFYKGKSMTEKEFYSDERKGTRRQGLLNSLLR